MCLAAADDATRQRCVRALQAAGAGNFSSSLQHIASTVALKRSLFGMRSVAAITAALTALRIDVNQQSLAAANFNFSLLKALHFDPSHLRAGGFDAGTLKAYGCTAEELMPLYGLNLAALVKLGYNVKQLKAAGFGQEEVLNEFFCNGGHADFSFVRGFACIPRAFCFTGNDPPFPLSIQRDGAYLYASLHMHKVNDVTKVEDGDQLAEVASGWAIAPNEPDVIRVCGMYKWQTCILVLDDGSQVYSGPSTQHGIIWFSASSHNLVRQGAKVAASERYQEVLLRKLACGAAHPLPPPPSLKHFTETLYDSVP